MKLEELRVYNLAMEMGEEVWKVVAGWDGFAKDTVGKQWVRAADSVAANLSEGFGRFHYKESRNFNYYARGSLSETRTWLTKAHNRGLVSGEFYKSQEAFLVDLSVRLNNYIYSQGPASTLKEPDPTYQSHDHE